MIKRDASNSKNASSSGRPVATVITSGTKKCQQQYDDNTPQKPTSNIIAMGWLYRSPTPMGKERVFNIVHKELPVPAFAAHSGRGGEGESTPYYWVH